MLRLSIEISQFQTVAYRHKSITYWGRISVKKNQAIIDKLFQAETGFRKRQKFLIMLPINLKILLRLCRIEKAPFMPRYNISSTYRAFIFSIVFFLLLNGHCLVSNREGLGTSL